MIYSQGDIGFVPLATFGKSVADVDTAVPLRAEASRLVLLEGEVTGHHHGFWPQPVHLQADAARSGGREALEMLGALTGNAVLPTRLYQDHGLASSLPLLEGAPVIGFLVCDEDSTVRHASIDGTPTGEHDDLRLPAGGYVVLGKREQTAGEIRRVAD